MNEIMISTVLCNILIGCFCVVVLSWAVVAIQTVINDFRREKREEKKSAQDDEYHQERMKALKCVTGLVVPSCHQPISDK